MLCIGELSDDDMADEDDIPLPSQSRRVLQRQSSSNQSQGSMRDPSPSPPPPNQLANIPGKLKRKAAPQIRSDSDDNDTCVPNGSLEGFENEDIDRNSDDERKGLESEPEEDEPEEDVSIEELREMKAAMSSKVSKMLNDPNHRTHEITIAQEDSHR